MANAEFYLTRRNSSVMDGQDVALFLKAETTPGVFEEPATTDGFLVTADLTPDQDQELHDDEQRRAGSRSMRDPFQGRTKHGGLDVEAYYRGSGTAGTVGPLHALILGAMGTYHDGDGAADNIVSVSSHSATQTVFDITGGAGADYSVGDLIRFKDNNSTDNTNYDGEYRLVTGVSTDTITVKPGFSRRPQVGTTKDQIQSHETYKLSYAFTRTHSALAKMSEINKQLTGCAVEKLSGSITGQGVPLKLKATLGSRKEVYCARDQVRGDASTDAFLSTDTVLRVGDARFFEVGARVNLRKITVATDAIAATETLATVTAVNTSNNRITLTRGSSAFAATDLQASVTSSAAGTYDTTTAYNLDVNIDYQGWVTLDLDDGGSHGAGLTRAVAAANLNSQLKKSAYNRTLDAQIDLDWFSAFSDGTTGVTCTSSLWGSQSSIQFRASSTASAHTLLGFTVGATTATNEVQIYPWTPGAVSEAAHLGEPDHNGFIFIDGFRALLQSLDFEIDNNVAWREDEKANDDFPSGFTAPRKRKVTVSMKGRAYGDAAHWLYRKRNQTAGVAIAQVGMTAGKTFALAIQRFFVENVEFTGDEEVEFNATLRVAATSTLEDEIQIAA